MAEHYERATRHVGITSKVEQNADDPNTFHLRVEGNTIIPTIDVERTYDEELKKYCDTQAPGKPPRSLTRQTQIINTWAGGTYEVTGTFRCELPPPPSPIPSTMPLPPSSMPPGFTLPVDPPPAEKPKPKTPPAKPKTPTSKKKTKKKGCNCTQPDAKKPAIPGAKPPLTPIPQPRPATNPVPAAADAKVT